MAALVRATALLCTPKLSALVRGVLTCGGISCRSASNNASAQVSRHAGKASGILTRQERMRPKQGDPFFRDIWRKFQLKVHPDLFTRFPELQAVNADSLQRLQGLLNEVKSMERPDEDRVKPRSEKLQFFVRTNPSAADGEKPHFLKIPVTVHLTGEYAHNSLAGSLARLFGALNLPSRWHWGNEYFASTFVATPPPPPETEESGR